MIVSKRLDDRRQRILSIKAWEGCAPEATVTLYKPCVSFCEVGHVSVNWDCGCGVCLGDVDAFAEMMVAIVAVMKEWEAELPRLQEVEMEAVKNLNSLVTEINQREIEEGVEP